jgi:hypothetical protein
MSDDRKFGTRDQILSADDLPVREIEVPEWGFWVRVKTLTGEERDAFEAAIVKRNGRNVTQNLANIRARLVANTVVDEAGARLFKFSDIEALGKKSALALDRVFGVASELSGLNPEDVEELAKNSASDQSDDSISA